MLYPLSYGDLARHSISRMEVFFVPCFEASSADLRPAAARVGCSKKTEHVRCGFFASSNRFESPIKNKYLQGFHPKLTTGASVFLMSGKSSRM